MRSGNVQADAAQVVTSKICRCKVMEWPGSQ
jgi:hypothetical protein